MRRAALGLALWLAAAPAFGQMAGGGNAVAPTPPNGDNSNRIATTAWVLLNAGGGLAAGKIFIGSALNVATPQTPSGDLTLSIPGVFTFNTVNANVGTFGTATQVPQLTVNAKGLITAVANVAIAVSPGAVALASGHILVGNGSNVAADVAMSGDCTIALTGAITCTRAAGAFNVVGNLTVGGTELMTNAAAPASPAAGTTRLYSDSTTKIPTGKNDAGTVSNMVVAATAAANQFATAISSAGVITFAQPAFTNLSGSAACTQLPALTGDVTTTVSTCATTIAANAVTNAKAAQMAAYTIKCNSTTATANAVDCTPVQADAVLNLPIVNYAARGGGFEVWQRLVNAGTTIALPAQNGTNAQAAYANDGWYLLNDVNQASHVNQVTGIATGSVNAAQVIRDSGATGTGVMRYAMPLDTDELVPLRSSNVALSFTMKEGANQSFSHSVTASLFCGTGAVTKRGVTAYTSETAVISTAVTLTTTATRFTAISAGTVPAGATQCEIQFNWTPSGTAGADDSFTVDDLQLETVASASATASPYRKTPYSEQLTRAQRFLTVFNAPAAGNNNIAFGYSGTTSTAVYTLWPKVTMRARPSGITVSSAAHFNLAIGNFTSAAALTVTYNSATTDSISVTATITGSIFTVGQGSIFAFNNAAGQIVVTGGEI